jgi:hypothetical protein
MEYRTTVFVELYRVKCPECGPKIEKVDQVMGKIPFSKRFEDAVGQACESAAPRSGKCVSARRVTEWTSNSVP